MEQVIGVIVGCVIATSFALHYVYRTNQSFKEFCVTFFFFFFLTMYCKLIFEINFAIEIARIIKQISLGLIAILSIVIFITKNEKKYDVLRIVITVPATLILLVN